MDPLSYLLGDNLIEVFQSNNARRHIMSNPIVLSALAKNTQVSSNAQTLERNISKPEPSEEIFCGHISMVSSFLNRINFKTYREKSYKHRLAREETFDCGNCASICLGLGTTTTGRRKLPKSKVFVVNLVCRGTSLCSPNTSHGRTSLRRHCGYGLRLFSRNASPTTIHIEQFGKSYESLRK